MADDTAEWAPLWLTERRTGRSVRCLAVYGKILTTISGSGWRSNQLLPLWTGRRKCNWPK